MVAILSKIFGLTHLELIEDAVQDTFIKATLSWRNESPDNPEAWLTQAAKNRVIDLIRQVNAGKERQEKIPHGSIAFEINDYFLDHEVEDSQLRMIFVACHPVFSREEQIAFALKTISGFSMKEIAAALLQKEETIKKRLVRARKKIQESNITLSYPDPADIPNRIGGALQIIYLIFNEGFHSTKPDELITKDLCGEALRLCRLLLTKENFRSGSLYALFALLCFHSSRLEAKVSASHEIVDLKNQDRSKWYMPLIILGNDALGKAREYDEPSVYLYEAAIAAEHVRARKFENTDWEQIIKYYETIYDMLPSDSILLSLATVHLQINEPEKAKKYLDQIDPSGLNQRQYLLHGCYAEYYDQMGDSSNALSEIDKAIDTCPNKLERKYLEEKKVMMERKQLK